MLQPSFWTRLDINILLNLCDRAVAAGTVKVNRKLQHLWVKGMHLTRRYKNNIFIKNILL
ncbi:MAG: hypothetical protein CSA29_05145 [Desulfobacterales bacterium]|nr:MAG: hypothetical protein CSA29_05145 [Desulfobacterales bacterium]